MGVDTRMRALFPAQLSGPQVVSFVRWADETFEDTGFFHTASAFHGEGATLLALDWESIEPEQSDAFEQFARGLAKKAMCEVAVFFDCGDEPFGDLEELQTLCEELDLDGEAVHWPNDATCWTPLDPKSGRPAKQPQREEEPPRREVVRDRVQLEVTPQRLLRALAELPDEVKIATSGSLEFSRDELGRFTRLFVHYGDRKLAPWLEVLRGHVRHVTVAERYDVDEVRDGLDLSVRVKGEKNPFLDD